MGWSYVGAPIGTWGQIYWNKLHLRAINWPAKATPRQVLAEQIWLQELFKKLPCQECCRHASRYYWQQYPDLRSNHTYHVWFFLFHNAVNQRLGKREISYQDYQDLYREALIANQLC